jgi:TonB family protein
VLISQEGDIKLCDFGIAKAASKASHTQAGALKGKLQYMSPEQAWGKPIDRRSDIFALGTVLFEMLTNRKLFSGENEMSILEQVREAKVEPPSRFNEDVAPEVDRIVLKALAKEPSDRFDTAAEMARDLDAVLYELRPTPTSADLAIYMHRLNSASPVIAPVFEPEPVTAPEPPRVTKTPVAVPTASTPPGVMMPRWEDHTAPQKKSRVAMIVAAALIVAVASVGGYFYVRSKSPSGAPAQRSAATVASPAPKPVETTSSVASPVSETGAAASAVPTTTAPVIDPTKVDEEVQKRLAAERARLEADARKQQVAAVQPAPQPLLQRVVPQPQPQPVVVAQPQPQPQPQPQVIPPPAPVPQPVVQPVVAPPPAPAPQPAAAVDTSRTREGDLIASGSEDVPAKMTRRALVPYPPMARIQRVQGTVLISALISETGRVLDAKVIRPINKAVGLNEAALQIVRQSSFSPPMKDGVRVKSWTTVPVDFKL